MSHTYGMEVKAVKHYDMKRPYSFTITPNNIHVLLGDNGLGKTTLLKIMAGYIHPKQGEIRSNYRTISYIQALKYIPHHLTVNHYLTLLYELYGWTYDLMLLHQFKIPLHKRIVTLSFGQKQKLLIVQAFMGNPDLILLDEPLVGLDSMSIQHFEAFLIESKKTVVITTHIKLNIPTHTIIL